MTKKKLTVSVVSDRLSRDENAWLKSLGEIGDLAHLVFELRSAVAALNHRVVILEKERGVRK